MANVLKVIPGAAQRNRILILDDRPKCWYGVEYTSFSPTLLIVDVVASPTIQITAEDIITSIH
jgi:hypothetical protein